MKTHRHVVGMMFALATASHTSADPATDTCRLLAAIGGNDPNAVELALKDIGARWPEENVNRAIAQMKTVASGDVFVGGNAYLISKLGDDMEEHLVVLRLKAGEISAMRLRYEWTPDGLKLVNLETKRSITDILRNSYVLQSPQVDCS